MLGRRCQRPAQIFSPTDSTAMPKRIVLEPGSREAALEAVARYFSPEHASLHTDGSASRATTAFALIATARVDYSCVLAVTKGTLYAADAAAEWHRTRVCDVRCLEEFVPEQPTRVLFDVEQVRGTWRCANGAVTRVLAGYLVMPNVAEAYLLVPRVALLALAPVLGQVTAHDCGAGLVLLRKHLPGLGYVITRLPSLRARRKMGNGAASATPKKPEEDEGYDPLEPALDVDQRSNLAATGDRSIPQPPWATALLPPAKLETESLYHEMHALAVYNREEELPHVSDRFATQGHAVAVACVAQAHAPLRAAHTYYDDALVTAGQRSLRMPELRTASRAVCHRAGLHLLGTLHAGTRHNLIADALLVRQATKLVPALVSPELPLRAVDVLEHLLTILSVAGDLERTTWLVERRMHPPHFTATIVFPPDALAVLQRLVPDTPRPPSPAEADASFLAAAVQAAASSVLCGIGGMDTITRAIAAIRRDQMGLAPLQQAALSVLPPLLDDSLGMIFRRSPHIEGVWELYDTTAYAWELVFVARAHTEHDFLDQFIRH